MDLATLLMEGRRKIPAIYSHIPPPNPSPFFFSNLQSHQWSYKFAVRVVDDETFYVVYFFFQ